MRAAFVPQGESIPLRKPGGGYQLIPVVHLALAWWAYREKIIRLVDLRVWFAAWEMKARRCRRPSPLPCRFGLAELRRLTGLSLKRLKESLRRLEAARLLAWSASAIGFPASPESVPLGDLAGFRRFLDAIPNHRRLVPVPRRTLRLLAGGAGLPLSPLSSGTLSAACISSAANARPADASRRRGSPAPSGSACGASSRRARN